MQYLFLFKNEWPYDPSFEIREPKDGGECILICAYLRRGLGKRKIW